MARILKVPYLGTAEDDVLLAQWLVAENDAVRRGQAVAAVETLKASFEVEAEHDGVLLRQLVREGERVALQAAIGVVGEPGEKVSANELDALLARERATPAVAAAVEPAASRAAAGSAATATVPPTGAAPVAPIARRRAVELGVDIAHVRGTGPGGLVKLEDVEAASRARPAAGGTGGASGVLDPEFTALLKKDGAAFAALSSEFKLALYRKHGASIGANARLGTGAILRADQIVLGADAHFGDGTEVDAHELRAGDLLHFGKRCRVRCTKIACGDNAFFTDDVEIGGGGAMDPEAELVVGSHGFVGEHVHLNPCRRLEIGDEVVISRNAVVMTHSFGGSALRGYPSRFAGVRIGSFAQIGIHATLFPGVEVGEGAILMSGSSLVSAVPAGRMYGGVPARDLKAAAQALGDAERDALARELVLEFARQLRLRGRAAEVQEERGEIVVTVAHDGRSHVLRYATGALRDATRSSAAEDVRVALACDDKAWAATPAHAAAIDLTAPRVRGPAGPLADTFREFLRKRGVRLHPRAWAYRGGWL